MTAFDRLIERLTHRLRVDPELRMDVANELRCHLEDSAAEYRQAGYAEAEAEEAAVKALGDPTELAQALWLANRKRIRVRQVITWVGRVTLIPAAIGVTLLVAFHGMGRPTVVNMADPNASGEYVRSLDVTPEQRFVLAGDPRARTDVEREKSISDRWPRNPVYFANYVCAYLQANHDAMFTKKDPHAMEEAIRLLDRGRQLEAENAFYDVGKAAILLNSAGKLSEWSKYSYSVMDRSGKTRDKACWSLVVTAPKALAAGLAALAEAAGKPFYSTHVFDMAAARSAILPLPSSLTEHLNRTAYMVSKIGSLSEPRTAVRAGCAYALELAMAGKTKEATRLIEDVKAIGPKMAAGSRAVIELVVAQAVYEASLGHGVHVYGALDMGERSRDAAEELRAFGEFARSLWTPTGDVQRRVALHGGLLDGVLAPALPGYSPDLGPMRKTEYAMYERVALVLFLSVFNGLAIVLAVATGISLWLRRKQEDGPKLLFVGGRALATILLAAAVVPLAVYGLYNYVLPLGVREYGLNAAMHRVILEVIVTAAIMLVLLLRLSYSAIRRRARAAGMAIPPAAWSRWRTGFAIAGALFGAGVVLYEVLWYVNAGRGNLVFLQARGFPGLLILLTTANMAGWLVYEVVRLLRLPGVFGHFRRTLFRSLIPIVGLTVIIVGTVCGTLVSRAEIAAIRQVPYFVDQEIRQSNYRLLKERLSEIHDGRRDRGADVRG